MPFKRKFCIGTICLALVFAPFWSKAQNTAAPLTLAQLVQEICATYLENPQNYSLAVGIIEPEKVSHFYLGKTDNSSRQHPNENSVYPLGSFSKIYTVLLSLMLENEGKIHLDSSVYQYLPSNIRPKKIPAKPTVRQLLSHTANLSRFPFDAPYAATNLREYYKKYTKNQLFEQFLLQTATEKTATYQYSHWAYGLWGACLENISQQTYAQLLQEKIAPALALTHTSTESQNIIPLHNKNGQPVETWEFTAQEATMGINASLPDVTKFVQMFLDSTQHLFPMAQKSLAIEAKTPIKKLWTTLGWHVFVQKKYPAVYTQSGNTDGSSCYIAFVPETQTGVVILANSANKPDEIGISLLKAIQPSKKHKNNKN
ncbi:MAG: serine hydrolase [Chitinophagales bacterium]|nr:serine hydrolase [Bacteroidota bacterium]MCB9044262.1 serine hydrolase [Chitinophagales bacterium]